MEIQGMPERFWVVTKPSPASELDDICFASTFTELMSRARGWLSEDEIVGVYADEDEAKGEALLLLGKNPVRPQDALFAEVVVNVMVVPKVEEMAARELGEAAVEAVANAMRLAEERGHHCRLKDQVSLGVGTVTLQKLLTTVGG